MGGGRPAPAAPIHYDGAPVKLASRMSSLGTESAFEVLARAKALEPAFAARGKPLINLGIGAPDFPTPEPIVEAGRKALADGYHSYTPAAGLPAAREAVAEYLHARYGVQVSPAEVLIVPGGKPTMAYAVLMFGEPGAEILYPNPGFPIYESLIRFAGAMPVPIELSEDKGFSFDPEAVLAKVTPRTRLLILNTPANPTGGVVGRRELDRLVAGLERHPDVVVLADEIYSRLVYDGLEHTCLLSYPSIRDRTILLDGWSKTYAMTGWRLGFGVWPKSLYAHAERLQINTVSCTNAAAQVAAASALRGPQEAVERMRRAFDERRKILVNGLNQIPGFRCVMPKGAFYAFPNVTGTGYGSRELQDLLLERAGVATVSGPAFGAFGEGYLRFSYASSAENIREALRRVRECLEANPARAPARAAARS
jgi:aspartate/methionine/tyrosine aminotransferase